MFDDNIMELLNLLDEGITVIDSNSRIVFINYRGMDMENIDVSTAGGRHILEVYPSLSEKSSTLLKVLTSGEAIYDYIQTFKNYKGEGITTINTTIPLKKNKKIIGAIEISKDITQMKKLYEEVVDLKSELVEKFTLNDAGTKKNLAADKNQPKQKLMAGYTFMDIIGESSDMLKLKAYALKAAESSSPVLIYGDTGTGKELFVQAIHNASQRKSKPFIAQNCAALPSTLLEGILFGTVKGSFTGAEDRAGLFEIADGGTLYLDEINSMPIELQAKLLRVLQDGAVRRVGDIKETKVDVRIIASTNIEPELCIKNNSIRKDLYYRINVIGLKIPELKNRKSDIPLLIDYFINIFNKKLNKKISGVSQETLERLVNYEWPGNVRELNHVIEGIMNLKEKGIIEEGDLPENIQKSLKKPLNDILEEVERNAICEAIKLNGRNISKASEYLDIPRQTLQYKIKKYDITI